MNSMEMKEELKLLSIRRNITLEQIRELVYLVFKFVRDKIKSANRNEEYYPITRVMGLGIFYVTKARQNKVKEKLKK